MLSLLLIGEVDCLGFRSVRCRWIDMFIAIISLIINMNSNKENTASANSTGYFLKEIDLENIMRRKM